MALYPNATIASEELRFDLSNAYHAWRHPMPLQVRQRGRQVPPTLSERHLQCIWYDAMLRPDCLKTREGETVHVLSPGIWNLEAGPDFLGAILRIGDSDTRECRGDVEIHVRPADWNHHGHARDQRYRNVIAHITYDPGDSASPTLPPGTVQISLRDTLAQIPSFSLEAVDLTAYPYAADTEAGACAAFLGELEPDAVTDILETAGAYRIEQKANRVKHALRKFDLAALLYQETMGALGFKHNASAFRQLAKRVHIDVLEKMTAHQAYALLMGVAGLLPATPSPRLPEETRAFFRSLWDQWWSLQSRWQDERLPANVWTLSSLRPQNHPARRLAAAATLFAKKNAVTEVLERTVRLWQTSFRLSTMETWFTPQSPLDFWSYHLGAGGGQRLSKPVTLVGRQRLAAWMSNVLVPILAATGHDVQPWLPRLPSEQTNSVMRLTAHRLLGRDHNPSLYAKHGLRQQGLMQIFHDFCVYRDKACQQCPLRETLIESS